MLKRAIFTLALIVASPAVAADDLSAYTPIPNVVPGTSFIRLYGLEGTDTSFELRAFGQATGREYQGQSVAVGANAVKQQAVSPIGSSDDRALTVYVKGSRPGLSLAGAFQHVKFNGATGEFENMSVCSINPTYGGAFGSLNNILLDVHTSVIPGYTSYISIINRDIASAHKYQVNVKDAASGLLLGQTEITVGATSTFKQPFSLIAQAIGFKATADQPHVTIEVVGMDGGPPMLTSHVVVNEATGTEINMSTVCPIFPADLGKEVSPGNANDPCNFPDTPKQSRSEYVYGVSACGLQDWSADRATRGRVCVDCGADGFINKPGDVDWWKVDLVKGRTYLIKFASQQFPIIGGDPVMSGTIVLRNSLGIAIPGATDALTASEKTTSGLPPQFYIIYTATETATYYVEISAAQPSDKGAYQVSVQGVVSLN